MCNINNASYQLLTETQHTISKETFSKENVVGAPLKLNKANKLIIFLLENQYKLNQYCNASSSIHK